MGVQEKLCFSKFTATPPWPTSLKETFEALNAMRVYSHSYWLVIFCTTNSSRVLARERWQTFEIFWKKLQHLTACMSTGLSHLPSHNFLNVKLLLTLLL